MSSTFPSTANPSGGSLLPADPDKRRWIMISCGAGAVAGAATAAAFVQTMQPSERAKAAGAPVEADIGGMNPGELRRFEWRGKPVWVVRRTSEMLASLKQTDSEVADPQSLRTPDELTPKYAQNEWRSRNKEYLVVVGICSHLGCSPVERFAPGPQPSLPDNWVGGFLCPCHGSTFDLAGRVFKNKPAPDNLQVPPYKYLSETKLLIGEDETTSA